MIFSRDFPKVALNPFSSLEREKFMYVCAHGKLNGENLTTLFGNKWKLSGRVDSATKKWKCDSKRFLLHAVY